MAGNCMAMNFGTMCNPTNQITGDLTNRQESRGWTGNCVAGYVFQQQCVT